MSWSPTQYLRFEDLRLRPALDLLARSTPARARHLYDLGCGQGQIARLLADRFPAAEVVGLDSSPAMLAAAREAGASTVLWRQADLAGWHPPAGVDLLFANAVLHWLDDHLDRLAAWLPQLAPGGVLAIQVPHATDEPSHALIRTVLREQGLGGPDLIAHLERRRMPGPEHYHNLLAAAGAEVEAWETRYLQPLRGEHPVFEWVRGTALRPVIDALDADQFARFEVHYRSRLRDAYPARPDGVTLYPFPRVFAVGRRR